MEGTADAFMEKATNDAVLSIVVTGANSNQSKGGTSSSSRDRSQEGFGIKPKLNVMINDAIIESPGQRTPQRPPRTPNGELIRRRSSLAKSGLLKTKSRLVEPPYPIGVALDEESSRAKESKSPIRNSPKASPRVSVSATAVTPKTPLFTEIEEEDEDDDVYVSIDQKSQKSRKRFKVLALVEWMLFLGLIGLLVASLTIHRLEGTSIWSVELWKWCLLALVIISGRLFTEWFINVVVYLVERNFLLKRKVLYFIYGLKKSVQVFLWLALILVAWILLFSRGENRSRKATKVLHYITMAIAGCLVGAGLWLLKTLSIKIVALSFHVQRFFDRIQETLFHQYVLETLSGPPLMEIEERLSKSRNSGALSIERVAKGKGVKEEVINVDKLQKMNQAKVSAWTMRGLVNVIRRTKLSTISKNLDYEEDGDAGEQSKEITSEWEARTAADKIFNNIARPGHKYIDEEDLLRFMKMDEVNQVLASFEGAIETGKIKKKAMRKYVVNAYLERKSLAHSLNDTKTAVKQLNKIASVIILIIDVVVWNLMMGFLTTKILVFITSQLLLVVFMFGNSVKTMFEAIIFVFIMHPYDVGDRCVIDGVQMVVEEMNILTTVFLRYDNEKIFYPNSVLSTKAISNFYRSPEMSDSVEFAIDFSTTVETIAALRARIKVYIESKPQHWRPSHSVQVKDIVNMNKMTLALYVNHTINFQNIGDRSSRKTELILELKRILEDLDIKYNLLPQEVHVVHAGSPASTSVAHR